MLEAAKAILAGEHYAQKERVSGSIKVNRRTALAGAVGALALLLLFSGAVALALSRGHEPECHCFGQLHSAPAGREDARWKERHPGAA